MDNKLNLDALRRALGNKTAGSATAAKKSSRPIASGGIPAGAVPAQNGGLKLISLEKATTQPTGAVGLKLVTVDPAAPASSPPVVPTMESSTGMATTDLHPMEDPRLPPLSTLPEETVEDSSQSIALEPEDGPVFKTLSQGRDNPPEVLEERFNRYQGAKRKEQQQRMFLYGGGSVVAAVLALTIFFTIHPASQETKININPSTGMTNGNNNAAATAMISGTKFVAALKQVVPLSIKTQVTLNDYFQTKTSVTLQEAIQWGMRVTNIPELIALDPQAGPEAGIWRIARLAQLAEKKTDLDEPLTPAQLTQLLAFFQTKIR